jgi:hypothetical protein
MTIITTHYRYKRPPTKRAKDAAITGPVVTAKKPSKLRGEPGPVSTPPANYPQEPTRDLGSGVPPWPTTTTRNCRCPASQSSVTAMTDKRLKAAMVRRLRGE